MLRLLRSASKTQISCVFHGYWSWWLQKMLQGRRKVQGSDILFSSIAVTTPSPLITLALSSKYHNCICKAISLYVLQSNHESLSEFYICISTLFVFAQYLCIVFVLITAHCPLSSAALWSPPMPFWSAVAAASFPTRSETRDLKQIRQHLSCLLNLLKIKGTRPVWLRFKLKSDNIYPVMI